MSEAEDSCDENEATTTSRPTIPMNSTCHHPSRLCPFGQCQKQYKSHQNRQSVLMERRRHSKRSMPQIHFQLPSLPLTQLLSLVQTPLQNKPRIHLRIPHLAQFLPSLTLDFRERKLRLAAWTLSLDSHQELSVRAFLHDGLPGFFCLLYRYYVPLRPL